jgi:hypothetical protein
VCLSTRPLGAGAEGAVPKRAAKAGKAKLQLDNRSTVVAAFDLDITESHCYLRGDCQKAGRASSRNSRERRPALLL